VRLNDVKGLGLRATIRRISGATAAEPAVF
jgi:hypothetical protein